jgi:glycosyltransferase involved in cell wall biosynthesis
LNLYLLNPSTETLLEAFRLFKQEGQRGTLLFVGDGGLRELLENKTREYKYLLYIYIYIFIE